MMPSKPLIILASARKDSDTAMLVKSLFDPDEVDVIDLLEYTLSHYRYTGDYPPEDQFMELMQLIQAADRIVFATPVYWYAMSAHLKVFFDRLTDIVTIHKQIGRSMKGKKTFLLAVGADATLPAGFEAPFRLTSDYLAMDLIGTFYRKNADIDVIDEQVVLFKQLVCAK